MEHVATAPGEFGVSAECVMLGQNTNLLNPHCCKGGNLIPEIKPELPYHTMSGSSRASESLFPVVLNSRTLSVCCLEDLQTVINQNSRRN